MEILDRRAGALASNEAVAKQLDLVADLLERQRANQYRVQAWRGGAAAIRGLEKPAAEILRNEGVEGLDRLPGIGPALARAIRALIQTGRLAILDRLRGEGDPLALLASVPGIGHRLAERVHEDLGIEALEELEVAAHDGRLARIPGFGDKRVAGVIEALATRLRTRRIPASSEPLPPVSEVLDVDREYRERAAAGTLAKIAPRRFNPTGERWLPVLHAVRGNRHYTALFSNTALAHRVGRTRDWVVIYYAEANGERQCTVVTATKGPLARRRVVRGRENECLSYYNSVRWHRRRHVAARAPGAFV